MANERERLAVIETDIKYIKAAVDKLGTTENEVAERMNDLEKKAAWYAGAIAVISAGLGWAGQFLPAIFKST
jgi:hypothetical protein